MERTMHNVELLQVLVEQAVEPALDTVRHALGREANILVRLFTEGLPGPTVALGEPESAGLVPGADGEVRVEVRSSSVAGRSLFVAEAVLAKNPSLRNYSGFVLNGDVREENGRLVVRRKARMNRYSVWDWKNVREAMP